MKHQHIWERAIRIYFVFVVLLAITVKGRAQTFEVSFDTVTIKALIAGPNEVLVRSGSKVTKIWVPGLETKGDLDNQIRFLVKMADDGADPFKRFLIVNNIARSFKVREYWLHCKAVRKDFLKIISERDLAYLHHALQAYPPIRPIHEPPTEVVVTIFVVATVALIWIAAPIAGKILSALLIPKIRRLLRRSR